MNESRGLYIKNHPEILGFIRKRKKVISSVRSYLDDKGIVEVETPVLCTHRELGPFPQFETEHPLTGKKFFLSFCPEDRLKRICSFFPEGVYEFARCFRGETDSDVHLSEFTMLEVKQPNKNFQQTMELAFGIIQQCALEIFGDIKTDKYDFRKMRTITCDEVLKNSAGFSMFDKDILSKSLELLDQINVKIMDRKNIWEVLDNLFKYFVEPKAQDLTFLINFPLALSTISRVDKTTNTAKRFHALLKGIEIGDGAEKMVKAEDYRKLYLQNAAYRQNILGIDKHNDVCEELFNDISIAEPIAGFGIGIDRVISILLDVDINDIILFPKRYDC